MAMSGDKSMSDSFVFVSSTAAEYHVMADDGSGSWPAWSEGSSESLAMTGRSLTGGEVEPSKAAERKMSGSSSDDSIIDQWRRSIVVSDVPVEKLSMLIMRLELKKRGGGKIDSYTRDADSRKVLVTFSDAAVAEHFLQLGSIDVLKDTMSISPAKLVSDGPESLRPAQPSSQQRTDAALPSQQRTDAALPTSSESNTSGDADELPDESEEAGSDGKVQTESVLEEMKKPEEDDGSKLSALRADSEIQSTAVTDVESDRQLSGVGDASDVHDTAIVAASSCSDSAVRDAQSELTVHSFDTVNDHRESECRDIDQLHHVDDSLPRRNDGEQTDDINQSDAADKNADYDFEHVTDQTSTADDVEQTDDVNQLDAAKKNTDHNATVKLSSDAATAAEFSEFECVIDHVSTADEEQNCDVNQSDAARQSTDPDHETADDEQTFGVNQSDAAVQNTDHDTAVEPSSDGDAAAGCREFEHVTDYMSTEDETPNARDIVTGHRATAEPNVDVDMSVVDVDMSTEDQTADAANTVTGHSITEHSATAEPGMDIDMSGGDNDSEANERAVSAVEMSAADMSAVDATISVLVSDIPRGLEETVEMYLESEKKGGGKILSFKYNRRSSSALVVFADNKVANAFIERRKLQIQGNTITVSLAPAADDDGEVVRDDVLLRTVVVHDVSDDMEEVVCVYLENPKKNGGPIESSFYNQDTRQLSVCFVSLQVADVLLAQGKAHIAGKQFTLSAATQDLQDQQDAKWQSRTVLVRNVPAEMEEMVLMFLENKRKGGGDIEATKTDERSNTVMVTFREQHVAANLVKKGSMRVMSKEFSIVQHFGSGRDIPRIIGMSESSSASLASDMSDSIMMESTVLQAPDDYVSNLCDERVIEVCEIPAGTRQSTLTLILESARHSGVAGVTVETVQFLTEDHSHALVTLNSAEVARSLVDREFVEYKKHRYVIRRCGRTADDVTVADAVAKDECERSILVKDVPDDLMDAVVSLLESDSVGSGAVELRKRDSCTGTMLFTFVSKDVAADFISRGKLKVSSCELSITEFTGNVHEFPSSPNEVEQPRDVSKLSEHSRDVNTQLDDVPRPEDHNTVVDHQKASVKSCGIYVSNIPATDTAEKLMAIFESERLTDIADCSVADVIYDPCDSTCAIVNFTDQQVVVKLLSKEFVEFKMNKYYMRAVRDTDIAAVTGDDSEAHDDSPLTSPDPPVIKVSSIPRDLSEQTVQMILENKRYGGGAIRRIDFRQSESESELCAVVEYEERAVAEELLKKRTVCYKNVEMSVSTCDCGSELTDSVHASADLTPADTATSVVSDPVLVRVSHIPASMSEEMIRMVFENVRYGGGDIKTLQFHKSDNSAVIEFESSAVADALIMRETVTFKGAVMYVSRHDSAGATVEVSSIPSSVRQDTLVMLFENTKRSGGGDVQSIDYVAGSGRARITFKDSAVAARLLESGSVTFKGHTLLISAPGQSPDTSGTQPDISEPLHCTNTIKVSSVDPSSVSKDMLSMYFENFRRSRGGDIKRLDLVPEKKKAFITFKDPSVVERVCCQPHTLAGATLSVTALESQPDVKVCAVQVSGILSTHTRDFISLYFENKKRSGGGPIDELVVDHDNGTAVVTFTSSDTVSSVLIRNLHKLSEAILQVLPLKPQPPPGLIFNEAVDEKRLLAKKLPLGCSLHELETFLIQASPVHILCWRIGVKPTTALLDFDTVPDYAALRRLVVSRPFKGQMIFIQKVPRTCSVLMRGAPADVSTDYISLYFEKHSGGEVVDIKPAANHVVVTFANFEVVPKVLAHEHRLQNVTVTVEPYYKWLGSAGADITETRESRLADSVTVVAVTCDSQAVNYITHTPELKTQIETALKRESCLICWPKSRGGHPIKLKFKKTSTQKYPPRDWADKCKSMMNELLSEITCETINVLQEIWNNFKLQVEESVKRHNLKIGYDFDNDSCNLNFVGQKDASEFRAMVESIRTSLEEELRRKQEQITETITTLAPHQLMILYLCNYADDVAAAAKDVRVEITQNEVHMTGMTDGVKRAKLKLYEKVSQLQSGMIPISKARAELMENDAVKSHLVECFRHRQVVASWSIRDTELSVFAFDKDQLSMAIEVIQSVFVEKEFSLDASSKSLMSQQKWKEFKKQLTGEHKMVVVHEGREGFLVLCCVNECSGAVEEKVQDFIEKNSLVQKLVPLMRPVADLLEKFMSSDLEKIGSKLTQCGGHIKRADGGSEPGFVVLGSQSAVELASCELVKLTETLAIYDHEIDRPGVPAYLMSTRGTAILSDLQRRHQVVVELESYSTSAGTAAAAAAGRTGNAAVVKYSRKMGSKQIVLVHGDITRYPVDAIVNAANEDLDHIGGVAKAIADAGGLEVTDDCHMYVKLHGRLLPGQTYVSKPGRLPCKAVIHAVGPTWRGGHHEEENLLSAAVLQSLQDASERRFQTIAVPAISSGIFGFPLNRATEIILSASRDYLTDQGDTFPREVHVVDNDPQVMSCFEKTLKSMTLPSEPGPEEGHSETAVRRVRAPRNAELTGNASGAERRFRVTDNADVLQTAEGVTVSLVKGSIVTQKVDVLVNTTSKELVLSNGAVSQSILSAAGPQIQAECSKNMPPQNFKHGDVVETQGYQLPVRCVYHGACSNWDNGAGPCEQIMRNFLVNIFTRADRSRFKSIAIPAIGTGNLRIPHSIVTAVMFDEVQKFSLAKPTTTLKDIRFVVYDKDLPTVKAFQQKIAELSAGGARQRSVAGAGARAGAGTGAAGAGTGAARASGGTVGSRQRQVAEGLPAAAEAGGVSFDSRSRILSVGQVKMRVKEGDITKEKADAVINSTNERIDMTGGAVAKAILRSGGEAVKRECQQARMGANRLCITTGGDLPATYIIHVVAAHDCRGWKTVISNCLHEAETNKLTSIAFPLLGTGQIGMSPRDVANAMTEAVVEFAAKSPMHLHQITVCIYQSQMVQQFAAGVAYKASSSSWQQTVKEPTAAGPRAVTSSSVTSREPHRSRVIAHVYARTEAATKAVVSDIEKVIGEYLMDKVLDQPQDQQHIAKLTEHQVRHIKALQEDFTAKITVEKGQRINRIRIQGPPNEVTSALDKIHHIFHEVIEQEHHKFVGGQAQWEYFDNSDYEPYPDEINIIIENAFQDKRPYAEWEEQSARYRLTFETMEEEMANDASSKVKVRRNTKEVDVPSTWTQMKSGERFTKVELDANGEEYKRIEQSIRATSQNSLNQILKIERIQNPALYKQYVIRKTEMEKANPMVQNERTLWHGTSVDTVPSINDTGFNRSYCGKNATVYGRGVYFASNFSYSASSTYSPPDATGTKYVYQSLVLTGQFVRGAQSMIVPPSKPSSTSVTSRYDSVVDNETTPSIFVVFYDTQAYPQYLITFK